jgi:hypothetical protein
VANNLCDGHLIHSYFGPYARGFWGALAPFVMAIRRGDEVDLQSIRQGDKADVHLPRSQLFGVSLENLYNTQVKLEPKCSGDGA